MKIAVFSDSHGNGRLMLKAVKENKPDMIIHLGDSEGEIDDIKKQFPDIPLKAVRGNCDFGSTLPKSLLFEINGVKIYICHGHTHSVKCGITSLLNAAHFQDAKMVMYGHTHKADMREIAGIKVLNPGSCGSYTNPSWAEVIITDNGTVAMRIIKDDNLYS